MAKGVKTGGRTPGVPNRATKEVREAIALFAQNNASKFAQWIEQTALGDPENGVKPQPDKAADLYLKAIEYHIPKLARQEHVGEDGGPVKHVFEWQK